MIYYNKKYKRLIVTLVHLKPKEKIIILKKSHIQETLSLSTCLDRCASNKKAKLNPRGTPYSSRLYPMAEHPTQRAHAPTQNTLLTVDLSHCGTLYSTLTCPILEHLTHLGFNIGVCIVSEMIFFFSFLTKNNRFTH